jgi:hypothetical protein
MTFGGDGAKKRLGKSKLVKSHSQSRRKKWSQDQMQETHTAFQKTPFTRPASEDSLGLRVIQGATIRGDHYSNYSSAGSEVQGETAFTLTNRVAETP